MSEPLPDRRARLVAALEKQFDACNAQTDKVLAGMAGDDPDYFNMPIAIALMRLSGQLGLAIARVEKPPAPPPEESRNRGSIPK